MTEQIQSAQSGDQPDPQSPSSLLKAYVDQQVEHAVSHHYESEHKGKKWRNSWRAASPITKGSFIMTAGIAAATIAYAVIAGWTLHVMRGIAADNSQQAQQLIDAANQIKRAGWTFSGAAMGTNNAVWGAVGKLGEQSKSTQRIEGIESRAFEQQRRSLQSQSGPILSIEVNRVYAKTLRDKNDPERREGMIPQEVYLSYFIRNQGFAETSHFAEDFYFEST